MARSRWIWVDRLSIRVSDQVREPAGRSQNAVRLVYPMFTQKWKNNHTWKATKQNQFLSTQRKYPHCPTVKMFPESRVSFPSNIV